MQYRKSLRKIFEHNNSIDADTFYRGKPGADKDDCYDWGDEMAVRCKESSIRKVMENQSGKGNNGWTHEFHPMVPKLY